MADTFCPVPWNFQAIQNNGCIRICCQMNQTPDRGTLLKDDGSPYNAKDDDLTESRNAALIKEVRKAMLNDEWHPSCARCKNEEEVGLNSRRMYETSNWPTITKELAKQFTQKDGYLDTEKFPLVYYDLRFGNLCNLACRMCGPEDSHTWYKDWAEMYGTEWNDTHGKVVLEKNNKGRWVTDAYDWHYSTSFWDQIESNLHNIEMVYMAGGEPMMIERHYDFLQKCIDAKVAKNIVLEYNTNLTNIPNRVTEMWKYFKQVKIGASIDGFGDVLEYQRYPAKWKQIEKNLRIIDDLPDNIVAWIACTVTNLNVFHIPDFMMWKLDQGYKKINNFSKRPIITYHVAHRPWTSSIRVLPQDLKKQIDDYYDLRKKDFARFDDIVYNSAVDTLDAIKKYMNAKDESHHLETFVNFTKQLDKLRKQNILDIIPEYKPLFETKA